MAINTELLLNIINELSLVNSDGDIKSSKKVRINYDEYVTTLMLSTKHSIINLRVQIFRKTVDGSPNYISSGVIFKDMVVIGRDNILSTEFEIDRKFKYDIANLSEEENFQNILAIESKYIDLYKLSTLLLHSKINFRCNVYDLIISDNDLFEILDCIKEYRNE